MSSSASSSRVDSALGPSMPVAAVFVLQLGWFTVVVATLVRLVVWPWSARLPPHRRAALFVAPALFYLFKLTQSEEWSEHA